MKIFIPLGLGFIGLSLIMTGFAAPSSGPSGENPQGLFATYFSNLTSNPCSNTEVITGFNSSPGASYLQSTCTNFGSLLGRFFGGYGTPGTDEVLSGFDTTTGAPIYKSIEGQWKSITDGIAYTGGKVGIGTPSPGLQLEVYGAENNPIGMRISNEGAGNSAFSVYQLKTSASHSWANMLLNNYSGTPYFQMSAGVGVGAAYFNMPNYYFGSSTGTNWLTITNAGNVGIGKIAPTSKLHIVGNTRIEGDVSVDGLLIGGKRITAPPVCTGTGRYLQYDGTNWKCIPLSASATSSTSETSNPATSLKVYVSNTSPADLSQQNGTIYSDQTMYFILDGADQSNPPRGCAKPAGTSGCNTASEFRAYAPSEWVSSTRIVSGGASGIPAYTFPNGTYEFYVLYGSNITQVGIARLRSSIKVYVSNTSPADLSQQNGTIYSDQTMYFILDGADQSNPPRGCAKPAGTSGCNTASEFRAYAPSEWVSSTRIVSGGASGIPAYTFPNGTYEFYVLYGSNITQVGIARLRSSPASTYVAPEIITTGTFAGSCGGWGLVDTEYYCGGTPSDGGWIQQSDGCYHRCLGNISGGVFYDAASCGGNGTEWMCASPNYGGSPGGGFANVGGSCYHRCY